MAVFRIERTKDYTVMSNHHLRNHELSLKAKGLLSMMLSLPDDWNNPVDLMFDALEAEKPNHFAVRQYKKYKLAAGDVCSK